jgi:hypothetical protein
MFPFVQIAYWLALSTWFGGVLFIAVAAPVILSTVRENNPILPTVRSVNLENQHGTLLASSIVSNLIERFIRIELICAAALCLAIVGQWGALWPLTGSQLPPAIVRAVLFVGLVVATVYKWRVLWPRVNRHRQHYIEHADEPDVANAARDEFERHHKETVTVLSIQLGLLLGIVLFSANISTARQLI